MEKNNSSTAITKRYFGQYGVLPTEESSFLEGLDSGRAWDQKYKPGGPTIRYASDSSSLFNDPEYRTFCTATQENHRQWMRGWDLGRCQTLEVARQIPVSLF